jgi:putative two-component system response regulator
MAGEPNASILIVDDEPFVAEILGRWLAQEGYRCKTASDGKTALGYLASDPYDLVVTDIMMPGMTGIELLQAIKADYPDIAVLMVTAVNDRDTAIQALKMGAYGYSVKPMERNDILIGVADALERRRITLVMRQYEQALEMTVMERTAQVRKREQEIIFKLVSAAGYRHKETGAHVKRIGHYAAAVAEQLGWDAAAVDDIRVAAAMHDVGIIGVPDSLLRKTEELTSEEMEILKKHTTIGSEILGASDVPVLQMASDIALSHHEKWDGTGYPAGLAGEAIPESARIVAVVDVFDNMEHGFPGASPLPDEIILERMGEQKGKEFDPRVFDCFLGVFERIKTIRNEVAEPENADHLQV